MFRGPRWVTGFKFLGPIDQEGYLFTAFYENMYGCTSLTQYFPHSCWTWVPIKGEHILIALGVHVRLRIPNFQIPEIATIFLDI